MKNPVSIALLLALASCAVNPPPIVDLAGKDPVKHQRDMAECAGAGQKDIPFFGPDGERAHYYSRCLEQRGYTVLLRTR